MRTVTQATTGQELAGFFVGLAQNHCCLSKQQQDKNLRISLVDLSQNHRRLSKQRQDENLQVSSVGLAQTHCYYVTGAKTVVNVR